MCAVALSATQAAAGGYIVKGAAELRIFNKLSGRGETFRLKRGDSLVKGGLRITLRGCRRSLPQDPPASAAFLRVERPSKGGRGDEVVYEGWLFATAEGRFGHPIYSLRVSGCLDDAPDGDLGEAADD